MKRILWDDGGNSEWEGKPISREARSESNGVRTTRRERRTGRQARHSNSMGDSKAGHQREEDQFTPPYQVHIQVGTTHYRIAVNVKSQVSPSELLFLVNDDFHHSITATLPALPLVRELYGEVRPFSLDWGEPLRILCMSPILASVMQLTRMTGIQASGRFVSGLVWGKTSSGGG